jgi:hypothetical protein
MATYSKLIEKTSVNPRVVWCSDDGACRWSQSRALAIKLQHSAPKMQKQTADVKKLMRASSTVHLHSQE